MAQMVNNLPAVQETLGWEDPLEKGMAIHSSIPAWKIPWTDAPSGLHSMGSQRNLGSSEKDYGNSCSFKNLVVK